MFSNLLKRIMITKHLLPKNTFHHLSSHGTMTFLTPNLHITNQNYKYNLNYQEIKDDEISRKEGKWTNKNVFVVDTGKFTGRSPNDKYIVKNYPSESKIWWGEVNKPISEKVFDSLEKKCLYHYNHNVEKYYIFDGFCGSNKKSRKRVRFITEYVWQHHFVKNMFIECNEETDIKTFEPDMTIINASNITNKDWKEQKMYSENFICFNIEKKLGLIGGTHYGGEMKKGIFSLMNYWLPQDGILPMHCSANINKYGDTTLFFGLSGTGKTTLSTDETTNLIGDDEHGWDTDGIFNFEGGCYAKTIDLKKENEPLIYNAIKTNAMLENVPLIRDTREPDYSNREKTENGRVSYPLSHLPNIVQTSMGSHPKNIIFLCCDMFGVLPIVSKLSNEQAIYYFLSGYTSKVGGTERGITSPQTTFSPCFGGAFLTLPPMEYGRLLHEKIKHYNCNVFLVNTGWYGGMYGVGKRYSISKTRKIIDEIMSGVLLSKSFEMDEHFHFQFPTDENPQQYWNDKSEFLNTKRKLIHSFRQNFTKNKYPNHLQRFGP